MPMYDTLCKEHGVHEVLVKHDQTPLCPVCQTPTIKLVSMPAKTAGRWGDTGSYFDRGMGCQVENSVHKEQLMKQKGLTPLSDYKSDFIETHQHKQIQEKLEHDKTVSTYKSNLKKFDGDTVKAVCETFPSNPE